MGKQPIKSIFCPPAQIAVEYSIPITQGAIRQDEQTVILICLFAHEDLEEMRLSDGLPLIWRTCLGQTSLIARIGLMQYLHTSRCD